VTPSATGSEVDVDVLIIGGGPAGSAAAGTLAAAGHHVVVLERRSIPRPKTCGDALSPLAVRELGRLGIGTAELDRFHRVDRVRLVSKGRSLERNWPGHLELPNHGYVARRDVLDQLLMEHAVRHGAVLRDRHEALSPIVERGFVRGAEVIGPDGQHHQLRARYTLVADGANSRFGRSLGTYRERSWPYATAIRSYWTSPLHDAPLVESVLDLIGADGRQLAGWGWVFPEGDGTVNIGLGVISTSGGFRSVNTSHLLEEFVASVAERWQLPSLKPVDLPVSGRIPMGGSVGPTAGPTHLVAGDAAGTANPLTGAGIDYALVTGRMAGSVLAEALSTEDPTTLQRYPQMLADSFGAYFKVGRLLDRLAGRPAVMEQFSRVVVRRPSVADAALRISLNELRPWRAGAAEAVYRLARTVSRFAPES
jgi:geranylgeranyl reductase family protein